jgi:phosphoribosylamine--glycine ligase
LAPARASTPRLEALPEANISHVICAPGNAGIARAVATAPVDLLDTDAVIQLADRERIDAVVGPEAPLGNRAR